MKEFLKRLQDRHVECSQARAKTGNKVALETEKEKDAAEKEGEELKRQLQPKRAHTDDDAGDVHEMLGRTGVGTRHARVSEVEETDRSPTEQISWWKTAHVPIRPFGQKTNLLSQDHQGFGIMTRGLP